MKKIAIIGNGDINNDCSHIIDSCDFVLRFNLCRNYGGTSGNKIDTLCLVNTGRPGKNFAKHQQVRGQRFALQASRILFSRPKNTILKNSALKLTNNKSYIDYSNKIITENQLKNKDIEYVSKELSASLWEKLLQFGKPEGPQPSSGICAIEHIVSNQTFKNHKIFFTGFSWQGSSKHPWSLERQLIQSYIENNTLTQL